MKISELKNAPGWLVKADTLNADVEITKYGFVMWNGGDFRGGNFLGGVMMPHCRWIYGLTSEGLIKIGCKEKTIEEWYLWFSGAEEFETNRDSIAFKKIYASYEATKAYLRIVTPTEHD